MDNIFKQRFKLLKEEYGMSFEKFGEFLGISKQQAFRWSDGSSEPDTAMIARIAQKCEVSSDWLIGISDIRTPVNILAAHRANDGTLDLPEEALASIESFKDEMRKLYKNNRLK